MVSIQIFCRPVGQIFIFLYLSLLAVERQMKETIDNGLQYDHQIISC